MPATPEVLYARSEDDLTIAYTDVGEGPPLVFVPGFISHCELNWETPGYNRGLERMTKRCRVVMFDKRGTGLSDRSLGFGTLEARANDALAVMDAAGIERASLFGISEGGPLACYLAATRPDRVDKLVLYGTYARVTEDGDYEGIPRDLAVSFVQRLEELWNTGEASQFFCQHVPDTDDARAFMRRFERYTATPAMVGEVMGNNIELDVRPVLHLISAPTLVVHCVGDPVCPVSGGRYLGEHIPGASYVELPGDYHISWRVDEQDAVVDQLEEFVLGAVESQEASERVLTTVLFTDIVNSTPMLRELGDARWRRVLDEHDRMVRDEIAKHRGREVKATGDGFLASFDGPARAVRCAQAIAQRARECGVEVRSGVHTGECELRGDDLAGIAVHLCARVMSEAGPGEVFTTRTVRDLVAGSGLSFEARGERTLKGVDEPVPVYAAVA